MATVTTTEPRAASRCDRLTAATDELHEHLHTVVAAAEPFASRDRFGRWLTVQYRFQRGIEPLYRAPAIQGLLPDMPARSRLPAIKADLADLEVPPPEGAAAVPGDQDLPEALGWLFVSEGSTLGAAVLLKHAQGLGLSDTFGARHLAAAPDGRAHHWKRFVAAVDAVALDHAEERRMQDAARAAFQHFATLLESAFSQSA